MKGVSRLRERNERLDFSYSSWCKKDNHKKRRIIFIFFVIVNAIANCFQPPTTRTVGIPIPMEIFSHPIGVGIHVRRKDERNKNN